MRMLRLLKKDLAKEISSWVEKEIISTSQAESISQLYDIDLAQANGSSTGYNVLVFLGYLFIGLALITLIGANWEEIPRWLRMAGLLTLTTATHALALRSYMRGKTSSATSIFMLGNFFYGASIILIAQIYHLGEHMPDGIFWWAIGSLPFGLLLRNTWLTLFSCVLGLIWFFVETGMNFFPTLFPLFILSALYVIYQGRTNSLLFLTVVISILMWIQVLLSLIWSHGNFRFELHAEQVPVGVATFIFAYAVSQWLNFKTSSKAKDYGVILSLWTLRFALLTLIVLSYADPWEELLEANWEHLPSMWQVLIILMAGALYLAWKTNDLQTLVPVVLFSLVSIITVTSLNNSDNAVYFQVVYNIALVCAGAGLVIKGINKGISHYFFLGVATILLTALMRYIDLVGEYIGGALLFILLASILLGSARYWKIQQAKGGTS